VLQGHDLCGREVRDRHGLDSFGLLLHLFVLLAFSMARSLQKKIQVSVYGISMLLCIVFFSYSMLKMLSCILSEFEHVEAQISDHAVTHI
jgi:hypothetical protein